MQTDQPASVVSELTAALARHSLSFPAEQIERLAQYATLLWEWNEKLNLTRHTDAERFVARDVVDSVAIERELGHAERILDVGTGGGVPGVVLAIIRPDLKVELSESVAKKAKAVGEIVRSMGLKIPVHHARAEDVLATRRFDTLVARAVAPLPKVLTWLRPFWGAFDRLLAIKGPAWVVERQDSRHLGLMNNLSLRKLSSWPVPGADSESVLLEIRPKGS